jgi:hypothetical protein
MCIMNRPMNHEVAVVGLGASGAFVARAAYDAGYKVTVYVYGSTTTPPGAFWLHWIPEEYDGQFQSKAIQIAGLGTAEQYTKLQWGELWYKGLTSSFPKEHMVEWGYNPQEVIPQLVPSSVKIEMISYPFSDTDVADLLRAYQFVFQTFPRQADIATQPSRVSFLAAAQLGVADPTQNLVVYNGKGQGIVVREAQLFGNRFLEFPKNVPLETVKKSYDLTGWQTVSLKDLAPNTHPISQPGKGLYLMGRYAQWDRNCLSHDCYSRTISIVTGEEHDG